MAALTLALMGLNTLVLSSTYEYDEMGRLVAARTNEGQNVRYAYDAEDRLTHITDSQNRTTQFAYDPRGRLLLQVDGAGGTTAFTYDVGDRIVSVKDPRGLETTYAHDGFGQLWLQSSPDTGVTTHSYDSAGQLLNTTVADGGVTVYAYDGLGRLVSKVADGQSQAISYDWCSWGLGRLCGLSSLDTSTHFAYLPAGQLRVRRDFVTIAGVQTDHWTEYGFDHLARPSSILYPNGDRADYGYSAGSHLNSLSFTRGGQVTSVIAGAQWKASGAHQWLSYGNGMSRGYNHDGSGRMTAMSVRNPDGAAIAYLDYEFTPDNEISRISDAMTPSLTQSMGYDALSRLTGLNQHGVHNTFSYDSGGNHDRFQSGGAVTQYAIDTSSNRVNGYATEQGSRAYAYDAKGNRISESADGQTTTYSYNSFNRMASSNANGVSTYYIVNTQGQRVGKFSGASASRYVYAGQNQLLAELNNGVWTNYLWFGGELVGLARDGSVNYVHTDHLGRPEFATNADRHTVWKALNSAYGRSVMQDTIGGLNIGFPGQYYDAETGLWYNGFRDYDATIGRYVQSDPIGIRGGINTYAYGDNDPITRTDVLGLQSRGVLRTGNQSAWAGSDVRYTGTYDSDRPLESAYGPRPITAHKILAGILQAYVALSLAKDGSESRPDNCPAGTLGMDKAKKKFGLDHDDVEKIKDGVLADPNTWTGIDRDGNVWVGRPGGKGEDAGHYDQYL